MYRDITKKCLPDGAGTYLELEAEELHLEEGVEMMFRRERPANFNMLGFAPADLISHLLAVESVEGVFLLASHGKKRIVVTCGSSVPEHKDRLRRLMCSLADELRVVEEWHRLKSCLPVRNQVVAA